MPTETPMFKFNNSYSQLSPTLFSKATPEMVPNSRIMLFNHALANELGLNLLNFNDAELAQLFSGHPLPVGSAPIAQAYAGHQFGHFTILGDGRAILLGEHVTPSQKRFDIQLKGSGKTPYSRRGDGKATLSAMLREYLMSEAMYHLNIPSSRSLSVVSTGENVVREEVQLGAVLTRIMESHIRVGTFEYISYHLPVTTLKEFTHYAIKRLYPELMDSETQALDFLKAVMHRQIDLMVNWMRVGFIHGVMNTDNMAISGETFDYGPCAFMNTYNPSTVFSSIDTGGRYAFGNQPGIAQWNLGCLASALLPIIDANEPKAVTLAQEVLNSFTEKFNSKWWTMMGHKIGFAVIDDEIKATISNLLQFMERHKTDYTNTFLMLQNNLTNPAPIFYEPEFIQWQLNWKTVLERKGITMSDALTLMRSQNPVYIPRNHWVEEALENACKANDLTLFNQILEATQSAYKQNDQFSLFQNVPEGVDAHYRTYCGT